MGAAAAADASEEPGGSVGGGRVTWDASRKELRAGGGSTRGTSCGAVWCAGWCVVARGPVDAQYDALSRTCAGTKRRRSVHQ